MKKQYFTTGELAKLLNISRATVSRKFDAGILTGTKNPITRERLISRDSVVSFAQKYSIDLSSIIYEEKHIAVVSPGDGLATLVENTMSNHHNARIDHYRTGRDALIAFSTTYPDICIIDDAVSDFMPSQLIKAFQSMEPDRQTPLIVYTPFENREKYRDLGIEEFVYPGAEEGDRLKNILYPVVTLTEEIDYPHESFFHRRKYPRISVNIPVDVDIVSVQTNSFIKHEEGILSNVSLSGALITNLEFHQGLIPSDHYTLRINSESSVLPDWHINSKVVRILSDVYINAGVRFLTMTERDIGKLSHLVGFNNS